MEEPKERPDKKLVHKKFNPRQLKKFQHKVVENLELQVLRKEVKDLKNTEKYKIKLQLQENEEISRLKQVIQDRQAEVDKLKTELAFYQSDLSKKQIHDKMNKLAQSAATYKRRGNRLEKENSILIEKLAKLQTNQ